MTQVFAPGSLVKARGREWVVLPGTTPELVLARPASGRSEEAAGFLTAIEKVVHATFAPPTTDGPGDDFAGSLLRDALVLGFRSAAGPLRSFADIAVEPRAYQLVPLLMALRLDPVRLLIADDVGVGKTIEAGLILKELLARGEISRFCVLCPPVVAQQWQSELKTKFHIDAELVLPSTAARLEKQKDPGKHFFEYYPFTIVSNDYIKADSRRDIFIQNAPECVIIDEAHGCANPTTQGGRQAQKHHRYSLAKQLSENRDRHLILVTATPHSGDEGAFRSLLCLLDPAFADLPEDLSGEENRRHRERLARNFVQRRRHDLKQKYDEETPFPRRSESEATWKLSEGGKRLLGQVQDLLRSRQARASGAKRSWYAALALLRSLASSPAAAATALEKLANPVPGDKSRLADKEEAFADEIHDLTEEVDDTLLPEDDAETEPTTQAEYAKLAKLAEALGGPEQDPKLATLIKTLKVLIKEGFHPIVFCRFIPTAEYLANHLKDAFPKAEIDAITGQVAPDLRKERVETLRKFPSRILVATDCLSEGINLQYGFTAIIHYDLSWNPTRHEQREGRVDRFGQKAPEVRAVTIYGSDHPVDQRVMEVLFRKEIRIRKNTGVSCPVPRGGHLVLEGFLEADLWGAKQLAKGQESLFPPAEMDREFELQWENAADRQRRARTIYAQESVKIDDLKAEADDSRAATGGIDIVKRFTKGALLSLGFSLDTKDQNLWKLRAKGVPLALRDEFFLPIQDDTTLAFDEHPDADIVLARTHPTLHALARHMVDGALATPPTGPARRTSVITTKAVSTLTTLLLIRMRFEIKAFAEDPAQNLLAEEALLVPFEGFPEEATWIDSSGTEALLTAKAHANTPEEKKAKFLGTILEGLAHLQKHLDQLFKERAVALEEAHGRVRQATPRPGSRRAPKPKVFPKLPVDILGVFVYLPTAQ